LARALNTDRNAPQLCCPENDKDAMAESQDAGTRAPRAVRRSQAAAPAVEDKFRQRIG